MKSFDVMLKERNIKMPSFVLLILAVLVASVGQILLKKGMMTVGGFDGDITILKYFLNTFTNIHVMIGLAFYVVGTLIWLIVLTKLPLSIAYPCLALGYVLVAISSKFVFSEQITALRWVGIITVCIGVFLISRSV